MVDLTAKQFEAMMECSDEITDTWLAPINSAMARCKITKQSDVAAFMANIRVESIGLTHLQERPYFIHIDKLLKYYGHHIGEDEATAFLRNPEKVCNRAYANRMGNGDEASGDGWRYRGHGPGQITGTDNFRLYSEIMGVDLMSNPDLLLQPYYGAWSFAAFWHHNLCSEFIAHDNFDGCCDAINIGHKTQRIGDANDYALRKAYWFHNCNILEGSV